MIAEHWKRICGIHVQEDGDLAAVWLAHDKETDTIHLYDSCMFKAEVFAVIAEGINARGRNIPAVVLDSEVAEKLQERGCRLVYQPEKETPTLVEITARDIEERMRSRRFKVDKRLTDWQDEYKTYYREGAKVPDSHPLMVATRLAVANLKHAKGRPVKRQQRNYPRIAIA